MLRVRAGTSASVTKTSTFSMPQHAAPGVESRAPSALQQKRKDAAPEKRSRTAGTREHKSKSITAVTSISAKKDLTEKDGPEEEESPVKDQLVNEKAEVPKPQRKKLKKLNSD